MYRKLMQKNLGGNFREILGIMGNFAFEVV